VRLHRVAIFTALLIAFAGLVWLADSYRQSTSPGDTDFSSYIPENDPAAPIKVQKKEQKKPANQEVPTAIPTPKETPKEGVMQRSWPSVIQRASSVALKLPEAKSLRPLRVTSVNNKWQWWPKVSATHKTKLSPQSEVLGEVDQHMIISSPEIYSTPQAFSSESPLVLYDSLRKRIGLLTGVFVVTAKNSQDLQSLESDELFSVVNSIAELNLVYLKPKKNSFDLNEVSNFLSHDPRVHNFEFEILRGSLVKI